MSNKRHGRFNGAIITSVLIFIIVIIATSPLKIHAIGLITTITNDTIGNISKDIFGFIENQSQGVLIILFIALIGEIINARYRIQLDQNQFHTIKSILDDFYNKTNKTSHTILNKYQANEQLLEGLVPDVDPYLECSLDILIRKQEHGLMYKIETRFDINTTSFLFAVSCDKKVFNDIVVNKKIQEFLFVSNEEELTKAEQEVKSGEMFQSMEPGTSQKTPLRFTKNTKTTIQNKEINTSIRTGETKVLIAKFPKKSSEQIKKRILTRSERYYSVNKKFVFWSVDRPVYLKEIQIRLELEKPDMDHMRMIPPLIELNPSTLDSGLPHEVNRWLIQGQNIMIAWDETI